MGRGCGTVFTNGDICDPDLDAKKNYVRRSKQTRLHVCHWDGCDVQVAPAKHMCLKHWQRLPKRLKDKVWATYRIGQEVSMTPSREYVMVMREVMLWVSCENAGL